MRTWHTQPLSKRSRGIPSRFVPFLYAAGPNEVNLAFIDRAALEIGIIIFGFQDRGSFLHDPLIFILQNLNNNKFF